MSQKVLVEIAEMERLRKIEASIKGNITAQVMAAGGKPLPIVVQKSWQQFNVKNYSVQSLNKMQLTAGIIYDRLAYPAAGQTTFTFFQRSRGSAGVTFEDTNMAQNGSIGVGNIFIATDFNIDFNSGKMPVQTGTDAALAGGTGTAQGNDYYTVMRRGNATFEVNGVDMLFGGIAPIKEIANEATFQISGGIGTGNAAADAALTIGVRNKKLSWEENPIVLFGGTSFAASVQFAQAVPLPSGDTGAFLTAQLAGFWMRPAS